MFFAKVLLLASLSALSANAMYTPLGHRSPHQHRGLAARVAAAAPEVVPIVQVTPRKRAVKRCKGSSAPIPSPTDNSSSSTPTPSQAPVNAGNAPPVFSSSSVSPSPTPSSSSAEHSSIHPHVSSSSLTPSSSPDVLSTSQPAAPVNPAPSPSIESSSTPPAVEPTPKPTPTPKSSSSPVVSSSRSPAENPSPSPSPSPTKKTTPAAAAPTPTPAKSSGGSGDSSVHSGDGTFYATGLGACGITNTDSDMIAAVAHGFFDSFGGGYTNPNNAPICNQRVRATYQGKSVDVTLTDRCGGCDGFALDFSPSAFKQLADPSVGRIHNVEWVFI